MTTTTPKTGRGRIAPKSVDKGEIAEIRVRIDAKTKSRAAKIFKRYGLTTSDGVRLLLERVLADNDIPRVPNAETQKALEEARSGDGEIIPRAELKKRLLGDLCGK